MSIRTSERPLLMVDIDGVISLFGFSPGDLPGGAFQWIDGIPHFLSGIAAACLLGLCDRFEVVWASGWEEKAEEYLPDLLGLPRDLPFLRFERGVGEIRSANAHWKLAAIEAHAKGRALAWIDDSFNPACHTWAQARRAPTLLVQTDPARGLTETEVAILDGWAQGLGERSP